MNRTDIRPAVIGIAAGVATIAGLIAWSEFEPHRELAYQLARRRLTAAERAELDRIAAEQRADQAERASFYEKQDAERVARQAEVLAGFEPQLLTTAAAVTSPAELSLEELVAEIVYTEGKYRSLDGWIQDPRASDHAAALREEWRRRNAPEARWTRSRVEQLRYDLARNKIDGATRAPYAPIPPFAPEGEAQDIYQDPFGVDAAAADREAQP
ncbi:hypothetical protein [Nocardia asteroides]|uniref:hypothetical protein n=1 Tax=Nocardia asteroides TaxID=1824 RepID=UPI0033FB3203